MLKYKIKNNIFIFKGDIFLMKLLKETVLEKTKKDKLISLLQDEVINYKKITMSFEKEEINEEQYIENKVINDLNMTNILKELWNRKINEKILKDEPENLAVLESISKK